MGKVEKKVEGFKLGNVWPDVFGPFNPQWILLSGRRQGQHP